MYGIADDQVFAVIVKIPDRGMFDDRQSYNNPMQQVATFSRY